MLTFPCVALKISASSSSGPFSAADLDAHQITTELSNPKAFGLWWAPYMSMSWSLHFMVSRLHCLYFSVLRMPDVGMPGNPISSADPQVIQFSLASGSWSTGDCGFFSLVGALILQCVYSVNMHPDGGPHLPLLSQRLLAALLSLMNPHNQ